MNKRLETIDLLRGFLFLNMAAYHWQYISNFVLGGGVSLTTAERIWQVCICAPFIFLAGCSSALSKNVLQQSAKILAAGVLITLGSLVLMPSETVWFGILTFIGTAYLSVYLFGDAVEKLPKLPLLLALMFLFILTFPYRFGQAHAADYFQLVPWLFLFWSGRLCFQLWGKALASKRWMHLHFAPLNFLGRHTLLGYLLHLPILYGIAYLISFWS